MKPPIRNVARAICPHRLQMLAWDAGISTACLQLVKMQARQAGRMPALQRVGMLARQAGRVPALQRVGMLARQAGRLSALPAGRNAGATGGQIARAAAGRYAGATGGQIARATSGSDCWRGRRADCPRYIVTAPTSDQVVASVTVTSMNLPISPSPPSKRTSLPPPVRAVSLSPSLPSTRTRTVLPT